MLLVSILLAAADEDCCDESSMALLTTDWIITMSRMDTRRTNGSTSISMLVMELVSLTRLSMERARSRFRAGAMYPWDDASCT